MLPWLLIKELMVSFDSTVIVSAVPSAGSLEACRLQHVGTAVCVREQRPLAVLLAQTAMQPAHRAGALVSPLEPWALGSWELFARLDFSYSPSCSNTPGAAELFELTSMDEPGFQAARSLLFYSSSGWWGGLGSEPGRGWEYKQGLYPQGL